MPTLIVLKLDKAADGFWINLLKDVDEKTFYEAGPTTMQSLRVALVGADRIYRPAREALGCYAGSASITIIPVGVGTARFSRKPAPPSSSRYSSTVRSLPPVSTSIATSASFPVDG